VVKILERFLRSRRYQDLQMALLQARKEISPRKYISIAVLSSIPAAVLGGVGGHFISSWLGLEIPYSLLVVLLMASAFGYLTYRAFLLYPSVISSARKAQIEAMLPHSVAYMYALSKGGGEVTGILRSIGEDESQGEMAREARAVVRNVEYLGLNPISAVREVARTTPSEKLRNFFELLASTMATGGDIAKYLESKCRQFYGEAGAGQRRSLESLGLMAEFYVIMLGLGPLLAVILLILFGMTGTLYTVPLYLLIYLLIPLGTSSFIILVSRFSGLPGAVKRAEEHEVKVEGGKKSGLARAFGEGKFSGMFKKFSRTLRVAPSRFFLVSVPIAAIFALAQVYLGRFSELTVFLAVLIAALPFAVLHEMRARMVGKIEDSFPDFLTSLSSSMASGLTPAQAIRSASASELGPLSSELRRVSGEVEWGASTSEALSNFDERIGSGMVSRSIGVMKKAMEASGEISDVVDILALDASTSRSLKQERRGVMTTYTAIVYMSFAVFIFTAGVISTYLLPMIPGAAPVAGMPLAPSIPQAEVKRLLFHASLIQGFCSGLVAGQLGSGDVGSGLKHSILMMALAYLLFSFWVFS
jgi:flagellar protein FlaJ